MLRLLIVTAFVFAALPALAGTYDLTIDRVALTANGDTRTGIGVNGQIPAPTLRWREGETVTINVTNNLDEDTSIHWHGILLPDNMDGVPGMSFDGIQPGETFTYTFTLRQHGTYWYHSHSGFQEQEGVFGGLIVDPAGEDRVAYDRDHVIILSDWLHDDPRTVLRNLKGSAEFYNYNRRTVGDFFRDVFGAPSPEERAAAWQDRLDWGNMRMDPTDIADISGYSYLLNGADADTNWTALFEPGERVRLRFVNASAMTYYDVRIPGLEMTVVNADGNDTQPVTVDQIRMAVAETYDVIVEPQGHTAYTIFAEARSREGFARGTLAGHDGMSAPIPPMSEREVLTMASMGPAAHGGMNMGGMNISGMDHSAHGMAESPPDPHAGHNMDGMSETPTDPHAGHNMHAGHDMGTMVEAPADPHAGHDMSAMDGSTMEMPGTLVRLSYDDLVAAEPHHGARAPDRVIDVRLTGNMHRYFWTINDVPFDEAEPIRLAMGERVRLRFINETMMDHPMHLHGMWMDLQNGNGHYNPRKHTISIAPGAIVEADVTVDAPGQWAFHCHLMFHMETGMMRRVVVAEAVGG